MTPHTVQTNFSLNSVSSTMKSSDSACRRQKLAELRSCILRNYPDVIAALAQDLGKPAFEATMDAGAPIIDIEIALENIDSWMTPDVVAVGPFGSPGASARIVYEPKGRVLIFGPWNFPFSLMFQPLIAAIAAGNTCVLKPSELAPATSAITTKIIRETFVPNEVTVIEGGPEVATSLLALPFDHVFFTGSTTIGRRVMAAASSHLASVTLELGGKCPVVLDSEINLAQAAKRIAWGKFLNAGQICLAPDHVWVPEQDVERFAACVEDYVRNAYYIDGRFDRSQIARVINEKHVARLQRLVTDALNLGAVLVCGGTAQDSWLEPTVLRNVPRDCALMREEIFGPIIPILAYQGLNDLNAALDSHEKPLAMYVFSERQDFIDDVLRNTSSGGVTINDVILHAAEPNLPFGGVGSSGMGAYHGVYGFRELSHARSVYQQASTVANEDFKFPPYADRLPG